MKKILTAAILLLLSLSLYLPGIGFAGDTDSQPTISSTPKEIKTYSLGEIVVSSPTSGVESVGTTIRITATEIAKTSARTLDEVLDIIPGIYVRTGNAGTPRIDIRGFRTRHVTLLLNGIPFNHTFDGQFDPTAIPVENIAEIKVITGGGSVLYGPGGNGGTINIITKKGSDGFQGDVTGEIGQENAWLGKFSISGVGEKFDAFISGSIIEKDGFPLSDDFIETDDEDGGRRENSDFERKNIFANVGYSPNPNTLIGLSYNHLEGENGVPPVVNYDKNDPFSKKIKYDRTDDIKGDAFQIALDHKTTSPLRVRGWLYFNQQDMLENRYDDDTYTSLTGKKGSYSSDSTSEIYGAHLQFAYDFNDRGTATIGGITEKHKWETQGFEIKENNSGQLRMNITDGKEDYRVHSAALEYETSPLSRLNLVIGYAYHLMEKDQGDDENDFSYLLGAGFDLCENTRLNASYAKKIRFPSIRQLYSKDGNPNLEAEKTFHYEAGIEHTLFDDINLSLTVFHIDAEDFIEKDVDSDYQNYEEYMFQGIEFSSEMRPTKNLRLRFAYSYLDSEDKSENSEKDELQHRPKNKFSFETTYHFPFGLTAQGDILRFTDIYFYDSDGNPPLLKKDLNDYTLVNIKLSQMLLKNTLEAYVGADNLFDENYEQSYGLPLAGVTFFGGMTYRF